MNNGLFLWFFLMLMQLSSAQELWNQIDANGNRHGKWKKNYDNGSIRYQGEFLHGKEIGTFQFYTQENSKIPDFTKEFTQNSDLVKVRYFYSDGKLKSEGKMEGKDRIGHWIYYFKDGKSKMSEESYQNGFLFGDYKIYYLNGKLTEWSIYKNGLLNGTSKRYSEEGILVEEINYADGKLNGEVRYYNTAGLLILKGTYLNDISVGAWEAYENGQLKATTYPNKKQ
jgi:antitoxin component YwqK of YwqJK toxin-antitoxin module